MMKQYGDMDAAKSLKRTKLGLKWEVAGVKASAAGSLKRTKLGLKSFKFDLFVFSCHV